MGSGRILSVNRGQAVDAEWAGRLKRTAIDKRPTSGRVRVNRLGLDGDEQADPAHHGGPEQALYVYAREDLDWWAGQTGRDLRDGFFGENITTEGLDVTNALIGERWQLGSAVVQVTACRIPCAVFRNWTGEAGWVKRFAEAERPGAYVRVLEEGEVAAGDPVTVLDPPGRPGEPGPPGDPDERVTVAGSMRAYYRQDTAAARRMVAVLGPASKWNASAAEWERNAGFAARG